MHMKIFVVSFIVIYILISLPAIVGIGHVIDWIPEATVLQKFKGYVIGGLTNNYLIKIVVSIIGGVLFSLFLQKRNPKLD